MISHEALKWKLEMHMAVKNIQYFFILNPNTLSLSILGVGGEEANTSTCFISPS